jgi:Domain of unknown function (DUF4838)
MSIKNYIFKIILTVTIIIFSLISEGKQVAVVGPKWVNKCLREKLLQPEGIEYKWFNTWLKPSVYSKYAVIYIEEGFKGTKAPWTEKKNLQKVHDYVKSGGVIIMFNNIPSMLAGKNNLSAIAQITGFSVLSSFPKSLKPTGVKIDKKFIELSSGQVHKWLTWARYAQKMSTAKPLGWYVDAQGKAISPCLTMNTIGKGKVFWCGIPLFRSIKGWGILSEADGEGVFVLNSKGRSAEQLIKLISTMIKTGNPSIEKRGKEKWSLSPLGSPGKLKYPYVKTKITEKSRVKTKQYSGSKFFLSKDGKPEAEIAYYDNPGLECAKILKAHLDRITGGKFKIVPAKSADKTKKSICIGLKALNLTGIKKQLPEETVVIKTLGNKLVVSSGDYGGLRYALYMLLEKFGCRYLWPGKSGKVIPHHSTLSIQALNIVLTPTINQRIVRYSTKIRKREIAKLKRWKIPVEAFKKYFIKALKSDIPDHGWSTWHKLGPYRVTYGHSFGDYWKRFGKSHYEWFALQPDGFRNQTMAVQRPRLCLSNKQLIKQAIADRIKELQKKGTDGVAVGLNDGGYTSFCMCKECRKLDPVNAPPISFRYFTNGGGRAKYVSLTDRVLTFSNRIMKGVNAKMPGKYGGLYIYSAYVNPPVKVKPHPSLKLVLVSGDYTDANRHKNIQKEWLEWGSFGNDIYWRPNILHSYREYIAPMNFSKKACQDLKLLHQNSLKGTDFDAINHHWALHGFIYYTISKMLWDPASTDYETILEDYCRSGFGPGWKYIRKYFNIIEQITDEAAKKKLKLATLFTPAKVALLKKQLNQAKAASNDKEELARISFLRRGLDFAVLSYARSISSGKSKEHVNEQIEQFFKQQLSKEGVAVNPARCY